MCKELSKTVEDALTLDAKNGNTFWADAISKEIVNVRAILKISYQMGKKSP